MSITAKELAEKLGLSTAAVSMALNNKRGVSAATRQKVFEAAEKYGYDFTKIKDKRTPSRSVFLIYYRKHGAIVNENPYFTDLAVSIQKHCTKLNLKLNIRYLYEGPDLVWQIEDILYSDCAGILLLGSEMSVNDFAPFQDLHIPLILLDVFLESINRDCILINNVQGAFIATDYLIRKFKTQPGYLRSSYMINNFEERADGFYKAIRRHGYSASKSVVHRLSPSVEGASADMLELLRRGEIPARCYFADNDLIAFGAMRAFRQSGYKIPEDIAIVGFDNIDSCNYSSPTLTTINVPKDYIGETAVARLANLLTAETFVPIRLQVQTNLVIRQST